MSRFQARLRKVKRGGTLRREDDEEGLRHSAPLEGAGRFPRSGPDLREAKRGAESAFAALSEKFTGLLARSRGVMIAAYLPIRL